MKRYSIQVAVACAAIAGFASATNRKAAPNPLPPPEATLIYPKNPADGMLWPNERAYVWSINRLDQTVKPNYLRLEIRVVHKEIPGNFITRAESEKTHDMSIGHPERGVGGDLPVMVAIQIIDFERVGLTIAKGSARLWVRLNGNGVGESSGSFGIEPLEIAQTYSAGSAANWKDGEMHLFTYKGIQKDMKRASYCFVLVQAEKRVPNG